MLAKVFTLASVLFVSQISADASNFPGLDIFHSHCGMNVKYTNEMCVNVYKNLYNKILDFNAG